MNPYDHIQQYGATMNVDYGDNVFVFHKTIHKNKATLKLHADGLAQWPCISLVAEKNSNSVHLDGVNFHKNCFSPPYEGKRGGGTSLLGLALHVCEDILQADTITLYDTSTIDCHKKHISLLRLSMLTTGDSWYGRYGFLPENALARQRYLEDRQTILESTMCDLSEQLQDRIRVYMFASDKKPITDIMKALFEVSCRVYYALHSDILEDLHINIINNYGRWVLYNE